MKELIQNQLKSNKQFIYIKTKCDLIAAHVKGNREENISFGKQFLKHEKFYSILIKWENARGKNPLIFPQPCDKTKTDESF